MHLLPLNEDHLDNLRRWLSDLRVGVPFLFSRTPTSEEHRRWFEAVQRDPTQLLFAIMDDTERHAGAVGYKFIDRTKRSAEFYIYLGPAHHGSGLGRRATDAALRLAFMQLHLESVYLHVREDNAAARRIYLACGFRDEGEPRKGHAPAYPEASVQRMGLSRIEYEPVQALFPRVALMQPMFLPWLGYFELLNVADIFVLLDDFQFSRQGWGQRNRLLLSPGRPGMFSLPIHHPNSLAATFLDVTEADPPRWRRKLLAAIEQSYRRAPFYSTVKPLFDAWLSPSYANIADLSFAWLTRLAEHAGIDCRIVRSSSLPIGRSSRSWRVKAVLDAVGAGSYYAANGSFGYMKEDALFPLEDMPVFFQDHRPREYPQLTDQFVPYLSALDAAFMLGPSDFRAATTATPLWLDWQMRNDNAARASAAAGGPPPID